MSGRLSIILVMSILVLGSCGQVTSSPVPDVGTPINNIEPAPPTTLTTPTRAPGPTHTSKPSDTPTPKPSPEPSPTQTRKPIPGLVYHPARFSADLPDDIVSILSAGEDGRVWLITERDILVVSGDTWEVYLSDIPGELVGVDDFGRVWVVDQKGNGISAWDGVSWTAYTAGDGWAPMGEYSHVWGRPVTDIQGRTWVVTDEDLRDFDGQDWHMWTFADLGVFHPLKEEEGLNPLLHVRYLDGIGEIWLASCNWTGAGPIGGQGVIRFDGQTWAAIDLRISDGCAEVIAEDGQGYIWLGLDGDIWRYDPRTGDLIDYGTPSSPFEDGGRFGQVDDIQFDQENNPWAEFTFCGGAGCGFGPILYRFEDGEWILAVMDYQYIRRLVIDTAGTPWLFTPVGIFSLAEHQLDLVAELNLVPDTVTVDPGGKIWFLVKQDDDTGELWVMEPIP